MGNFLCDFGEVDGLALFSANEYYAVLIEVGVLNGGTNSAFDEVSLDGIS